VQYLVGLAVVRACRDERALGSERGTRVRLKWPNDVYVDLPSEAGGSEKKKVGGILVNTSFSDGNVHVVVGALRPVPRMRWRISVRTLTKFSKKNKKIKNLLRSERVRHQRVHPGARDSAFPALQAGRAARCGDGAGAHPN